MRGVQRAFSATASLWLLLASEAKAQGSPAALEQFRLGQSLMDAKRYEEACPHFDQSHAFDSSLLGALFAAADCYRDGGKLATAKARYETYIRLIEQLPEGQRRELDHGRLPYAKDGVRGLMSRIPTLEAALTGPSGSFVTLDGKKLASAELGEPILLDPGSHALVANDPDGRVMQRKLVRVAPGDHERVELFVGAQALAASSPPPVLALAQEKGGGAAGNASGAATVSAGVNVLYGAALGDAGGSYGPGVGIRLGALLRSSAYAGVAMDQFFGADSDRTQGTAELGYEFRLGSFTALPRVGLGVSFGYGDPQFVVAPDIQVSVPAGGVIEFAVEVSYNKVFAGDNDGIILGLGATFHF